MMSPVVILIGWIGQIIVGYYFVRLISYPAIRFVLTIVPCVILTYMVSYDLPALYMPSMLLVTFCWLATIRLIHFIVISPEECFVFSSFILKILWMFIPIFPCPPYQREKWPIYYDFISAGIKLLVNHWMYGWLLTCQGSDSYPRLIMFYIFILLYSFLSDIQSGIIRLITFDTYMLKPLTNFPFLSQSLREFWGQRYNQLVGTVLRESVFKPVSQLFCSTGIGSLFTFFISGLLHVHLAFLTFKDSRSTTSTIIFFLLHGIVCSIETDRRIQISLPFSWLYTQAFLLATASLQIGPFTRIGPEFYALNTPPLFDQKWIPKLPLPNYCPN